MHVWKIEDWKNVTKKVFPLLHFFLNLKLFFLNFAFSILDFLQATSEGHRVLLSSPWYLNYISYGIDWPKYYSINPQDFGGSEAEQKLVIGGEVSRRKMNHYKTTFWLLISIHSWLMLNNVHKSS